ncbi:hypothetical protein pEaSNUABM38_00075 [Erwinia phage pEa_SNUABM_38]|nr:hypothetical protein pEaSNUABM38_00075 [Erwinia phage pEa_SNUABM_38]
MSTITAQNLKELLGAAQNGNPRLKTIIEGANAKGVNMDNAAKAAIIVANLMFAQNSPANVVSAATVRTFEAVLYLDLSQASGVQLDAATHNELVNNRQQALDFVQKQQNGGGNPFTSGGGNSSNNPFLSNNSNAGNSNNPFLSNNNASQGSTNDNPFLGTTSTSVASEGENIFTSAPTAPAQPAAPAKPAEPVVAQPVNLKSLKAASSMETYQDHELTVDYTSVAQPPRKTNETLKQFKLTGDWATRVTEALDDGKVIINFDDAEVLGKLMVERRTFSGFNDQTKSEFDNWLVKHGQQISDLEGLQEEDDIQVIMKKVNGTVAALRDNAMAYFRHVEEAGVPSTVKMDVSALIASYLNRLEELVLSGFRIGSNQCQTPDGRSFSIKNTIADLADFADSVFNHYCDNNGVCLEPDYFRELFLSVAAQLKKLRLKVQDGGEVDVEFVTFEIVTAGNYTNYDKENVVTVNSFGPLAEVLSSIYEVIAEKIPYASVTVQLPTGNIELLQSLDLGAPIRY